MASKINLPLVSVLILSYNQVEYIEETILSVLNQDYPNIEIIISDDCSKDGAQAIIEEYASLHPSKIIPLLNKQNLGITVNFKQAITHAKGQYILPLGGDDLILPSKISKQVKAFSQNPDAVICYHDVEVFQSDSNKVLYYFHDVKAGGHYPHTGYITEALILYRCFFCNGCSFMVSRNAIPTEMLDERLPTASDWLFLIRISTKGTAIYIDEVLGRYRRHKHNITKKITNSFQEEKAYNILADDYPEFIIAINKGKARLHLFFFVKSLLMGNFKASLKDLYKLIVMIFSYPYIIPFLVKSVMSDGLLQLKRYYNNIK